VAATLVSPKVIAQLFELTERRVRELAAEGVIPKPHRGQYDLIGCVRGYIRFLKSRALVDASGGGDLRHERTRLVKARADEAELNLGVRRRELVEIAFAVDLLRDVIGACRARLLAYPTKIAPLVKECESVPAIYTLLEREMHEALDELAGLDLDALGGERGDRALAPAAGAHHEPMG
jgi:phage terminase Nu1 subunit (DNA packaging protein)